MAQQQHVIGYDDAGRPVIGFDDTGKMVYAPDASKDANSAPKSLKAHAWDAAKSFVGNTIGAVPGMLKTAALAFTQPGYIGQAAQEEGWRQARHLADAEQNVSKGNTGAALADVAEAVPVVGDIAGDVRRGEYGTAAGKAGAIAFGPKLAGKAGGIAADVMQSGGRRVLKGLVKPNVAILRRVKDEAGQTVPLHQAEDVLVDRMLREGYGFSTGGWKKAEKVVESALKDRESAIAQADAAGKRINLRTAASHTKNTERMARTNPTEYQQGVADVRGVRERLVNRGDATQEVNFPTRPGGPAEYGAPLPQSYRRPLSQPLKTTPTVSVGQAQKMRTEGNRELRANYGKRGAYEVEAMKDVQHGLGEEISKATGGRSQQFNRTMQDVIPMQDAIESGLARSGKTNAVSLYDIIALSGGSKPAAIMSMLSKRGIGNAASRALYRSGLAARSVTPTSARAAIIANLMSSHGKE